MTLATTLERAGGYTVVAGTAAAVVWMFTQFAPIARVDALEAQHKDFVSSEEFQEYVLSDMYDSFYDFVDRRFKYEGLGNEDMVREIERQLARLRGKICQQDPEWQECDGSIRD